jgi:hypothetical protein
LVPHRINWDARWIDRDPELIACDSFVLTPSPPLRCRAGDTIDSDARWIGRDERWIDRDQELIDSVPFVLAPSPPLRCRAGDTIDCDAESMDHVPEMSAQLWTILVSDCSH